MAQSRRCGAYAVVCGLSYLTTGEVVEFAVAFDVEVAVDDHLANSRIVVDGAVGDARWGAARGDGCVCGCIVVIVSTSLTEVLSVSAIGIAELGSSILHSS